MEATNQHAQDVRQTEQIKPNPAYLQQLKATLRSGYATTADGKGISEEHKKILTNRGIDVELAALMGWETRQKDSIEIPFYLNGNKVNSKTRTIIGDKKFFQQKNGVKCFYNEDALADTDTVVITEGEIDCMIALQAGFVAVSVPDGAPKEEVGDRQSVKYSYLKTFPKSIKNIILAVDSDGPGVNLMNDLAIRLGKHRCRWVKYPDGCKDLGDTMEKYGLNAVISSLSSALYISVPGLYRLESLPPVPNFSSFDVGIAALGDNLRLRRGDFSVMTGIPSHGKSTFANNLAFNMIQNHGWQVCFASFEQPPQTEHRNALHTLYHGLPYWQQAPQQRQEADGWINDNISFIYPADDLDNDCDLTWLLDTCAAAVTRYGADMIVIDPWNELDHMYNQRDVSLTQYVGMAIKEIKKFAKKYQVHMMVVAHPAKMRKDKDGVYPVPTAYDISDSSHWYNKADQVIVVHQEDDGTLIRVAKSRYHNELGKPGDVKLTFDQQTNTFSGEPTYYGDF